MSGTWRRSLAWGLVAAVTGACGTGGGGGTAPAPATPAGPVTVIAPTAPDGIAQLVARVGAAVVNIDTEGAPAAEAGRVVRGVGSGFVVEADGLIVTNYHVVAGAERLIVTLSDGRELIGRVVGADPATDLAIVRVEAAGLMALALADPTGLAVGQYVVAMGSPLGLSQSVTMGILSALERDIPLNARVGFLQTDAPINPGNSGGPLLNLRGEVIGVNTAVARGAQGIGFAIPIGTLRSVLPQLQATGRVDHAWLGVQVTDLPTDRGRMAHPVDRGVLVAAVEPGSPADLAGLRAGDVIMAIGGQPLEDSGDLVRAIAGLGVGDRVDLEIARAGARLRVVIELGRLPAVVAP